MSSTALAYTPFSVTFFVAVGGELSPQLLQVLLVLFDKVERKYPTDYFAINILLAAETVTSATCFLEGTGNSGG